MDSKKLLSLLGAAGVVVHVAGNTVPFAQASSSPAALEQILQRDPFSDDASAAFDILADRANGKGNSSNNGNHGEGNNGNHGDGNNGNHGDGNNGHHGEGNHGNGNGNDGDDPGHYDG